MKRCTTCDTEKAAAEFYARGNSCKECRRQSARERRRQQPERVKAINRASYHRHADERTAAVRARYAKVAEHERAAGRERHQRNKERQNARRRALYRARNEAALARTRRAADPEHARAIARAWRAANPGRTAANDRRKRARRAGAEGTHSAEDVARIYDDQEGRCRWCAVPVGEVFHVDHVVPLSRGGTNWPDNICVACPPCNLRKHAAMPDEWEVRRAG